MKSHLVIWRLVNSYLPCYHFYQGSGREQSQVSITRPSEGCWVIFLPHIQIPLPRASMSTLGLLAVLSFKQQLELCVKRAHTSKAKT